MKEIKFDSNQLITELFKKKKENTLDRNIIIDEKNFTIILLNKRKEFENLLIKKGNKSKRIWFDYIKWEENNGSIENTRNIWHRFLSTYNKEKEIYLKYIHFELKFSFVGKARIIFEKGIDNLPFSDFFFFKYIEFEILMKNHKKVRNIFKKLLNFNSSFENWLRYIKFELVNNNKKIVRKLFFSMIHKFSFEKVVYHLLKFEVFFGNIKTLRFLYNHIFLHNKNYKVKIYLRQLLPLLIIINCEFYNGNQERANILSKYLNFVNFDCIKQRGFQKNIKKIKTYTNFLSKKNEIIIKKRLGLIKNAYNAYQDLTKWFEIFSFEVKNGNYVSILSICERILCLILTLIDQRFIKPNITFFERFFFILEKLELNNTIIKCIKIYFMNYSNNYMMLVKVVLYFYKGMEIIINILIRNNKVIEKGNNNHELYFSHKILNYFFEYKFFLIKFKELDYLLYYKIKQSAIKYMNLYYKFQIDKLYSHIKKFSKKRIQFIHKMYYYLINCLVVNLNSNNFEKLSQIFNKYVLFSSKKFLFDFYYKVIYSCYYINKILDSSVRYVPKHLYNIKCLKNKPNFLLESIYYLILVK